MTWAFFKFLEKKKKKTYNTGNLAHNDLGIFQALKEKKKKK